MINQPGKSATQSGGELQIENGPGHLHLVAELQIWRMHPRLRVAAKSLPGEALADIPENALRV
jgi:hypothetical protein